jgi:cbb3-type cytochrome oxidase maturation protein
MDGPASLPIGDLPMNIIYFLLPLALLLGLGFAAAFVFSVQRGQFDDLETPGHRVLLEDEIETDPKKGTST